VVVPLATAREVAEAGRAMDHIEGYVHKRLRNGDALPGLYPPDEKARAAYEAWVADGEPDF